MAAPNNYTETGLFIFMRDELQDVGRALNWVNQVDYQPAIDETLLSLGVSVIGEITGIDNIRRLRAQARVHMWRMAAQATAGDFDFGADGGDYKRSQMHVQCLRMQEKSELELSRIDTSFYAVTVEEPTPKWFAWPLGDQRWEWIS